MNDLLIAKTCWRLLEAHDYVVNTKFGVLIGARLVQSSVPKIGVMFAIGNDEELAIGHAFASLRLTWVATTKVANLTVNQVRKMATCKAMLDDLCLQRKVDVRAHTKHPLGRRFDKSIPWALQYINGEIVVVRKRFVSRSQSLLSYLTSIETRIEAFLMSS